MMKYIVFVLVVVCQSAYSQTNIIDDDFARKPFGKTITPQMAKKMLVESVVTEKTVTKNEHTGALDTLITLKSKGNEITFYKNNKKMFFCAAVLKNKDISLAKNIQVGQSKDAIIRVFGAKQIKNDLLIVTDNFEHSEHKFLFKGNKLVEIKLNAGVD